MAMMMMMMMPVLLWSRCMVSIYNASAMAAVPKLGTHLGKMVEE
jgi:hypothetical protein